MQGRLHLTYGRLLCGALLLLCISPAQVKGQAANGTLLDLARIHDGVENRRVSSYDRSGGNNDRLEHIKDGERRTIFEVPGAGMITHIWVTIAPPPPALSRNDIILRMYWDGETNPSVESPIGPFFGQGWDESYNFSSLPLAAGPRQGRAMVSYFVMPFSKGARIEIENDTGRDIDAFYYYVDYVAMDALPEDMGRFHAWYHREITDALPGGENEWAVLGPQGNNPTGKDNYLFADIEGKGQFVGVNYYVHSPTPMWYGEGDDMIFIDGDTTPTLHGTGTEDYFNTSWSPNEPFSHPYYGYARLNNDVGWLGRTHVYRFNITDPIYFDKSLRFTIEHGHNNNLTLDLASVAYWYQTEPHKVFPPLPDRAGRKPMPFIGPVELHRWRDAWRKAMGSDPNLWGNETEPKQP
ncbi:MAG TPA: glycoside hydrolase family 172 protein [Rhodothermales bacterium]|nr:glycoside hydrolase family 172 protein [Rhodothermales bacterium]